MSCLRTTAFCLNPCKYELTYTTGTAAAIISALAAIATVTGILAFLASQGVNIGHLNALSEIGTINSVLMTTVFGLLFTVTLAWMNAKAKKRSQELEKSHLQEKMAKEREERLELQYEKEKKEIDSEHLAKIFLNEGEEIYRTVHFQLLGKDPLYLYLTSEATLFDVKQKLAHDLELAPSQITLFHQGLCLGRIKTLEKQKAIKWVDLNIKDNATVWLFTHL